jgi:hypothetical protein
MTKRNSMTKIILICSPLQFYTESDEELLFQWLKKVSCIQKIEGIGSELHVHIISQFIPNKDLLNLMGIFDRYKFDQQQLLVFKNKQNEEWFDK